MDVVFPTLVAQTYQPIETILVDNGSTDRIVDDLARKYPAVRTIELGRNRGFSHALNHRSSD